jgi:hypothetical protein
VLKASGVGVWNSQPGARCFHFSRTLTQRHWIKAGARRSAGGILSSRACAKVDGSVRCVLNRNFAAAQTEYRGASGFHTSMEIDDAI